MYLYREDFEKAYSIVQQATELFEKDNTLKKVYAYKDSDTWFVAVSIHEMKAAHSFNFIYIYRPNCIHEGWNWEGMIYEQITYLLK